MESAATVDTPAAATVAATAAATAATAITNTNETISNFDPLEGGPHAELHHMIAVSTLLFIFLVQVAIYVWKLKSPKTFQTFTLLGVWVLPFLISLFNFFWRFLFIWSVFTAVTLHMVYLATRNPVARPTPRKVYSWFFFIYRISSVSVFVGYLLVLLQILLADSFEGLKGIAGTGIIIIFYGLYFGVLVRDCANVCTDSMARSKGLHSGKAIPSMMFVRDTCAICTESLTSSEKTFTLNCQHSFHEFCILGWSMIGKKDCCPHCSEKVDIKALFTLPWQVQSFLYLYTLDIIHYLLVWNPIIVLCIQLFTFMVDKEHYHQHLQ